MGSHITWNGIFCMISDISYNLQCISGFLQDQVSACIQPPIVISLNLFWGQPSLTKWVPDFWDSKGKPCSTHFLHWATDPAFQKKRATELPTNEAKPITRFELMGTKAKMLCMKGWGQTQPFRSWYKLNEKAGLVWMVEACQCVCFTSSCEEIA